MPEARRFLRVPTRLKAFVKKAESKDTKPLFHHYSKFYQQPISSEADFKKFGLPDVLKQYLDVINSKLDMLLSIQSLNFIEKDYPHTTEVVEIGGGGIKCIKPKGIEINVGDFLDLVIILSTFPLWIVSAIGEVKREEDNLLGIEFVQIKESDKENIIRFVFQEEREYIRKQKNLE